MNALPESVRPRRLNPFEPLAAFGLPLEEVPEAPAAGWLDGCLHRDERKRWLAMPLPKRRREWLAGRLCAKEALRACLAPPARASLDGMLIEHDEHNRPRLAGSPLWLSISHDRCQAVAVADTRPVGVDIERHVSLQSAAVQLLIAPAELACTRAHFRVGDAVARTVLWTLKEARFKCQGRGSFAEAASRWQVAAWRDGHQPEWSDAGRWPEAPAGCAWRVRWHADDDEVCAVVHAEPHRAAGVAGGDHAG